MTVSNIIFKSFYWKLFHFISSFVLNICLARILGASASGNVYSIVYLSSIFSVFFTFGFDISLNYYLANKQIKFSYAGRFIIYIVLIALICSLPIIWLYYNRLFSIFGDYKILLFSGMMIIGNLMTVLSTSLYTVFNKNHIVTKILFASNLILIFLILISNLLISFDIINLITFLYFGNIFLQGGVLYFYFVSIINGSVEAENRTTVSTQKMLRFSANIFIVNFLFFVSSKVAILYFQWFANESSIGNYIQAYKLVEYIGSIAAFIYLPVLTLVSIDQKQEMNRVILLLIRLSNTGVLLFSLLFVVAGKFLISFLYGQTYDSMYNFFLWLIPGLLAVCSSTFFTAYFFGSGKLKVNLYSAIIMLVSLLFLLPVCIHLFGEIGASVAFSIANLSSFIYDAILFKKSSEHRYAEMLLIKSKDLSFLQTKLFDFLTRKKMVRN